jgi:hypothetical protein
LGGVCTLLTSDIASHAAGSGDTRTTINANEIWWLDDECAGFASAVV